MSMRETHLGEYMRRLQSVFLLTLERCGKYHIYLCLNNIFNIDLFLRIGLRKIKFAVAMLEF